MLCHGEKKFLGGVVEKLDLPKGRGVARALLIEHLDHHVVRGLIDEGNQHLLAVEKEVSVLILCHGGFGYLPDKVPGQHIGEGIAQRLHHVLVDVAGLRGAHIGNGVVVAAEGALLQKFRHNFSVFGAVKPDFTAAQAVFGVRKQVVQRHYRICACEICGNVVRVGDADVGGGVGCDVGNDVIVDFAVVRIKPQVHGDVGIQLLEIFNGLLVDVHLGLVGVVFGPEGDFVVPAVVKGFGNLEGCLFLGTVAACEGQAQKQKKQQ